AGSFAFLLEQHRLSIRGEVDRVRPVEPRQLAFGVLTRGHAEDLPALVLSAKDDSAIARHVAKANGPGFTPDQSFLAVQADGPQVVLRSASAARRRDPDLLPRRGPGQAVRGQEFMAHR